MTRRTLSALFFSLTLLFASSAAAQTVNVEAMAKNKPGFGLALGGALSMASGNVNQFRASGTLHTQYQTMYEDEDPEDQRPAFLRQRVLLSGKLGYQTANDARVSNSRFAHARWTAMWWKRLGSEVFSQYQFSEFSRLKARLLNGVGGRVVLLHYEPLRASLGSAYMLEYEALTTPETGERPDPTVAHRWTNVATVELSLFDGVLALVNTVYVQPRFDDFSDVRVLEELSLDVAITKALSLGTALVVAYDSAPPTSVETTDVTLSQTFKLAF